MSTARSHLLVQVNSATNNATFLVYTVPAGQTLLWKGTDLAPAAGAARNVWFYVTHVAGLNAALLVKSGIGLVADNVYHDNEWRVLEAGDQIRMFQTAKVQATLYGALLDAV